MVAHDLTHVRPHLSSRRLGEFDVLEIIAQMGVK